jgi:hypothetical protein
MPSRNCNADGASLILNENISNEAEALLTAHKKEGKEFYDYG